MLSDPIADILNRIKTASQARRYEVVVPFSKMKESILKTLKMKGFIVDFSREKNESFEELRINLKEDNSVINCKRISKPGQRIYMKSKLLKTVKNGLGTAIISTSKGVMSIEEAKAQNLGGELLCEIY